MTWHRSKITFFKNSDSFIKTCCMSYPVHIFSDWPNVWFYTNRVNHSRKRKSVAIELFFTISPKILYWKKKSHILIRIIFKNRKNTKIILFFKIRKGKCLKKIAKLRNYAFVSGSNSLKILYKGWKLCLCVSSDNSWVVKSFILSYD